MPTMGLRAVNSYVKESPGLIGGWVMSGTPSIAFLRFGMPWRWSTVDWSISLVRTILTGCPTATRSVGPGTMPL
jgi:hypothetical protein